jgi:hypothetical protein
LTITIACLMVAVFGLGRVQLQAEAETLLLVTARHPITGEPRHPEAGLLATGLPVELVHLVVHHLALAHVPAERARLLAQYNFNIAA